MKWSLFTKTAAAEADYGVALTGYFGAAAGQAPDDQARNGSHSDHPLHGLYAAKNESADAWAGETQKAREAAAA
jgi:hypothetical protein